jgi:hypothetical protein
MAVAQFNQNVRWKGPFKELVEGSLKKSYEMDDEAWARYWKEKGPSVDGAADQTGVDSKINQQAASLSGGIDDADEDMIEKSSAGQTTSMSRQRMVMQILQNRSINKGKTIDPPTGDEITALHKFFERPWFRRIWIVQEVALSRDILIQCGPRTIDWWVFELGYQIANKLKRASRMGSTTQRNIVYMGQLRAEVLSGEEQGSLQLLPLLVRFRRYFATDARDKVFALLGFTQTVLNDLGLRPHYDETLEEVYIDVARGFLLHLPRLEILWVPREDTESVKRRGLPTWVPDWSDTGPKPYPLAGTEQFQAGVDIGAALRIFKATSDSKPSVAFDGPRRLQLQGFIFDDIAEVAAACLLDEDNITFPLGSDSTDKSPGHQIAQWNKFFLDIQSYIAMLEEWKAFARINDTEARYPATNEDNFTVFARTAWTDMDKRHYLDDCKEWLDTVHHLGDLFEDVAPINTDIDDADELAEFFLKTMFPIMSKFDPAKMSKLQGSRDLKCCHVLSRRLARTKSGYLCLVPKEARVGDHVTLLQGGCTPSVLRKCAASVTDVGLGFELVGETYVHGIMYGEAWKQDRCHTITLV